VPTRASQNGLARRMVDIVGADDRVAFEDVDHDWPAVACSLMCPTIVPDNKLVRRASAMGTRAVLRV